MTIFERARKFLERRGYSQSDVEELVREFHIVEMECLKRDIKNIGEVHWAFRVASLLGAALGVYALLRLGLR